VLAAVIVANSLTLTHYQRTDLGYSFVADFRYRLIHESLIFATFTAIGMGVGLYIGAIQKSLSNYLSIHGTDYMREYTVDEWS